MTIVDSTFINGTEVDLTNNFSEAPNLTLYLADSGVYTIKNYLTNETYLEFPTLGHAISYCNNNFDTNLKTI